MQPQSTSTHDQRQFHRMHEALQSIDAETLSISSLANLIHTLDFLVECLVDVDKNWTNTFRSKWGILEEVYAVALDAGANEVISTNKPLLAMAVSELSELIPSEKCK